MAPRYLTHSALIAVRYMAAEAIRHRRPRRASRVRAYISHPAGDLAPLALAVRRLLSIRAA